MKSLESLVSVFGSILLASTLSCSEKQSSPTLDCNAIKQRGQAAYDTEDYAKAKRIWSNTVCDFTQEVRIAELALVKLIEEEKEERARRIEEHYQYCLREIKPKPSSSCSPTSIYIHTPQPIGGQTTQFNLCTNKKKQILLSIEDPDNSGGGVEISSKRPFSATYSSQKIKARCSRHSELANIFVISLDLPTEGGPLQLYIEPSTPLSHTQTFYTNLVRVAEL